MVTYSEALDFLYNSLPVFQRQGAGAYKPGLDTSRRLAEAFGNPQNAYRNIHIAGTNGKGSTAHTLAAMLQSSGLKVGLYTSPHLVDFRERIRVNGQMIPKESVVDFVERYHAMGLGLDPSFFELTMVMAFEHFARERVDVAVIEAGLGGRLDSTNIINPELCIITNISFDHTAFLGDTLEAIAGEKAGIIKNGVPVIIGEAPDGSVHRVFVERAGAMNAPIVFADSERWWHTVSPELEFDTVDYGPINIQLKGRCQIKNTATLLAAARALKLPAKAVKEGFEHVVDLTGLTGRWMVTGTRPLTVTDTGHNEGGWQYLARQIDEAVSGSKHMILGFVNDKDVSHILDHVAGISNAIFYFTQPSVERRRDARSLAEIAARHGLEGQAYDDVESAYRAALAAADADNDMIFVGGSNFTVADFLSLEKNS